MVLMRMSNDEARQFTAHFLYEAYVGYNKLDPRKIGAGKGDATIGHEPFPLSLAAIAVERKIHADFAESPERHVNKLFISVSHCGNLLVEDTLKLSRRPAKFEKYNQRKHNIFGWTRISFLTSSLGRASRGLLRKENIAGLDCKPAPFLCNEKPSSGINGLKRALNGLRRQRNADLRANSGSEGQPRAAHRG